jgi:hypothetical protein
MIQELVENLPVVLDLVVVDSLGEVKAMACCRLLVVDPLGDSIALDIWFKVDCEK